MQDETPAADRARPLADREFRLFQALVEREAGIHLNDSKRALLVGRLSRRLRELGLRSFEDYYALVRDDPNGERVRMLDSISTNETRFFREPSQFELVESVLLPGWRRAAEEGRRLRQLRVWSAACSTGEEPYSLAMLLRRCLGQSWEIEILASDISTRALERARRATWPIDRATQIPEVLLRRFVLRGQGPQAGLMRIGPEALCLVRFERINLVGEDLPAGPFDLIYCRNVLIYFSSETRRRVTGRLIERLDGEGVLCLGQAECLGGLGLPLRGLGQAAYRHARRGETTDPDTSCCLERALRQLHPPVRRHGFRIADPIYSRSQAAG